MLLLLDCGDLLHLLGDLEYLLGDLENLICEAGGEFLAKPGGGLVGSKNGVTVGGGECLCDGGPPPWLVSYSSS